MLKRDILQLFGSGDKIKTMNTCLTTCSTGKNTADVAVEVS